ncbi:hypothetical protein ACLH04_17670 [Enterobacter hormaechei]|uniref:Uncharacterized protein n=1 Tax=Salmonella enterica TaxID=28901 RepID=A0A628V6Q2_SALER|nr:hypothetical protein [Enterobacter hormaechei]AVE72190.1 hypothetical protein AM439_07020 [Enterobacter cloacae complex sp.]EAR5962971.1 hypothetical protein [Salmonella enterica]EDX1437840.1 hypothetical protein [Salmonella enterica subsp. houtenae serovar 44:z4,z24:-]EDX2972244.1 hypothetical protein [Salmonella enterica subsp. enterica serovar Braenderup]HCJ7634880.1 hypothetical protein [Enterobacter hormaechei subsp. xiangfangensis]
MSYEEIPVVIPGEIECRDHNQLACIRFHYHLEKPETLPNAGELFTALTPEQAVDVVRYLQGYIQRVSISQGHLQNGGKPN